MDLDEIVIVADRVDRRDGKRTRVWIPMANVLCMEREPDLDQTFVELKPGQRGFVVDVGFVALVASIEAQMRDEEPKPEPGTFGQGDFKEGEPGLLTEPEGE